MARQQYYARYPERGESYARKVTEARTGREVVAGGGGGGDRSDRVTEEVDQEQMEDRAAATKRVREGECEGGSSGTDEDDQTSENNKTDERNKPGKCSVRGTVRPIGADQGVDLEVRCRNAIVHNL